MVTPCWLRQSTSNIWGNTNPQTHSDTQTDPANSLPVAELADIFFMFSLTMRGSHFAPWCMNQIYDVHYGCYYSAHAGRAVKHPYEAPDEPSAPRTHLQPAFFYEPPCQASRTDCDLSTFIPTTAKDRVGKRVSVWETEREEKERARGREEDREDKPKHFLFWFWLMN